MLSFFAIIWLTSFQSVLVAGERYPVDDERVKSLDIAPFLGRGYDNFTATLRSNCLMIDEELDVEYGPISFTCEFKTLFSLKSAFHFPQAFIKSHFVFLLL